MSFLFIKKNILFIFLLIFGISSKAQDSLVFKAYESVLVLDFNEANILLKHQPLNKRNKLYDLYLKNYQSFLIAYFNAEEIDYDKFISSSENLIFLLNKEKESAEYNRMKCIVAVQESFIHFQWNHKFKTAQYLLKGRKYLNKAILLSPKDIENIKLQALFEVLLSAVPEQYKSIAVSWGFKGDANKGLQLIRKYLSNRLASYQRMEGEIIQMFVVNFIGVENNLDLGLTKESQLVSYLSLITLRKNEAAKDKIKFIDSLLAHKNITYNYLLFLKARLLIELHKEEGVVLMNKFIEEQKGVSFIKSAYFYKYWFYCSLQDSVEMIKNKKNVIEKGAAIFLKDKKMLDRVEKSNCNSFLVSARLYFDAGLYRNALKVLLQPEAKKSLVSLETKIEFLYRLARIYEKTSRIVKAKAIYKRIINTKKSELYFVAYSSFLLAKIYLEEGDKKEAKKYFNRTLELNDGEYKTSIEQKTHYYLKILQK